MEMEIKDAIEELLKFTLDSSINGSFEIDLTYLILATAEENTCSSYKRLASALCELMNETDNERCDLKNKKECTDLMMENWSQLVTILKTVDFKLHVQEPFFTQLRDGIKTVEGRCAIGDYNRIGQGSVILFNNCLLLEVQEVHRYVSFFEMLEKETLVKVLPGVETIEEGVQVYRKFYSEEKENCNGVLGIHVVKPALQLYAPLARILSELGYEGIQSLLSI